MNTGLQPLIDGLSRVEVDSALIQTLTEKWWDTTHTFHFDQFGEMTMTPKDFSAISGLSIGGKILKLDNLIHHNYDELLRLLGEPIRDIKGHSIDVHWLSQAYRGIQCYDSNQEDIIVRTFLLALLGSTLFSKANNRVPLYYLESLKQIDTFF